MSWLLLACVAPPHETGAPSETAEPDTPAWTEDCLGLDEETTWACSEELF